VPVRLQRPDDAKLVLRRDASEDAYVFDFFSELRITRSFYLRARHGPRFDAEFGRDGDGRRGVVTRDHLDHDARALTQRNRVAGLSAGRIDDPDEADECEFSQVLVQILVRIEVGGGQSPFSDCQHTHRPGRQSLGFRADVLAPGVVEFDHTLSTPKPGTST
jgi:hypothetical protein